jgi:hypothetical protein
VCSSDLIGFAEHWDFESMVDLFEQIIVDTSTFRGAGGAGGRGGNGGNGGAGSADGGRRC